MEFWNDIPDRDASAIAWYSWWDIYTYNVYGIGVDFTTAYLDSKLFEFQKYKITCYYIS